MDHRGGRSVPLGESGNIISKGCAVDLVDEDAKERGGFVTRIGLESGVDFDDKRGGYS